MSARDSDPVQSDFAPSDFSSNQLFLRRLALSLVRDEARADDLVQDTWATWIERRPGALAAPRAWLARVLKNRAQNERRAEERRARREAESARPEGGEPGPSGTDGTLEAQARLVEALRRLDEPYRSTLLQRYYHDLSPAAIAERTSTSLNTVKARLTRGLEKLRRELDRRYGGDRGAWCHWLLVLPRSGASALPRGPARHLPAPPAPALPSAALPGSAAGTLSLGTWIALAGMLVAAVGWLVWSTTRRDQPSSPVSFERPRPDHEIALQEPHREPVQEKQVQRDEPAPEPLVPAEPPPAPIAPPWPFLWPQLAQTREHDTYVFKNRIDLIRWPREIWKHAGLSGQPTIQETELYSGGASLYRLDLVKDKFFPCSEAVTERIRSVHGTPELDEQDWGTRLARNGLTPTAWVAGAPAITEKFVLARLVADGSVSAFDRDLTYEAWHWKPADPSPCPLSGCLAGDLFIVAHKREVVALRVLNGSVEWRFELGADGEVEMVPACDGDLVYFASDKGVVLAVDLARGEQTWRVETGRAYMGAYPLVLGDRVVFTDDGALGDSWPRASVRALQSYDGRELWKADAWAGASPGNDERGLFTFDGEKFFGASLSAYSRESGVSFASFRASDGRGMRAAPLRIGGELVTAEDNALFVRDAGSGAVLWSYQAAAGDAVLDFVHAGDRIYVVTATGLVCLADDPRKGPAPQGFVLGAGAEEAARRASYRERRRAR